MVYQARLLLPMGGTSTGAADHSCKRLSTHHTHCVCGRLMAISVHCKIVGGGGGGGASAPCSYLSGHGCIFMHII